MPAGGDRRAKVPSPVTVPKRWAFGLAALLLLAVMAFYFLFESLLPLFLAFGLAYAFRPLIDLGERRGYPRTLSAGLLVVGICTVIAVVVAFVLPVLLREGKEFFETFPGQVTAVAGKIVAIGNRLGMDLPVNQELADKLGVWMHKVLSSAMASSFGSGSQIYTSLSGVLELGLNILIVPVFFFYLLRDLPALKQQGMTLISRRHRPAVLEGLRKIDTVFSSYIHGQLTVALILAVVFSACLTVLGVKYGLVIGILSGFLNLVPYLGQAVGGLLALLMVLTEFKGWGRVMAVPVIYSTINFIEGTFITPRIVGGQVGLTSLQTLVVLLLGADIGGLIGIVVAIPLAASIKVLFLDLHLEEKKAPSLRS